VRGTVTYSESPDFTQLSAVRLHWTRSCLIFLSESKKISEQCLKLGYPVSCTSFTIYYSMFIYRYFSIIIKNINTGIKLVIRNSIKKNNQLSIMKSRWRNQIKIFYNKWSLNTILYTQWHRWYCRIIDYTLPH